MAAERGPVQEPLEELSTGCVVPAAVLDHLRRHGLQYPLAMDAESVPRWIDCFGAASCHGLPNELMGKIRR